MHFDACAYLLLPAIIWTSRTINAFLTHNEPCYICAAEWKLRHSNTLRTIDNDEKAVLDEDDDKCEAAVIREVEDALKLMEPKTWQNTAIDGFTLKRDTDRILNEYQSLSVEQFQKKLVDVSSRWEKYRVQQDFNKWATLRHWLRLPGLRRRLQELEKDLKSEKLSRRYRRLLERVEKARGVLEMMKRKLQDIYAIFHREGKSQYSEVTLRKRLAIALERKLAQSRKQYFPSTRISSATQSQAQMSKCNGLNHLQG